MNNPRRHNSTSLRQSSGRRRKALLMAVPFVCLLGLWQGLGQAGILSPHLMPPPLEILRASVGFVTGYWWQHAYAGTFWEHAGVSTLRVLTGFSLAAVAGVLLGLGTARSEILRLLLDPPLQAIRSVPGITWLPIAMVWFGIGTTTTVFLIALAAFFPVYVNTYHGLQNVPEIWVRAAKVLGAGRVRMLWSVWIPAAWPSIRSGLRLALGLSWAFVVLGELTGVNNGLGAMIMDARMMGDVTAILVGMIFIAAIGRLTDLLFMFLTANLWRTEP